MNFKEEIKQDKRAEGMIDCLQCLLKKVDIGIQLKAFIAELFQSMCCVRRIHHATVTSALTLTGGSLHIQRVSKRGFWSCSCMRGVPAKAFVSWEAKKFLILDPVHSAKTLGPKTSAQKG